MSNVIDFSTGSKNFLKFEWTGVGVRSVEWDSSQYRERGWIKGCHALNNDARAFPSQSTGRWFTSVVFFHVNNTEHTSHVDL